MRTLKYRVYDKNLGEMCYFDLLNATNYASLGYPVDQFTGLLDKFGNEIYEGDIIDIKKGQGEHDKNVIVRYANAEFVINECTPLYLVKTLHGEGIGNIYENEDLIND